MASRAGRPEPRAILLHGPDEVSKKRALDEILDRLVPSEDRDLAVQNVDAGDSAVTGEAILHAARDRPMFSERRVVVVLNVTALKGPRHKRTLDALAEGIARLPEFSTLIFVAYAQEERGGRAPAIFPESLMAAIKKHGEVRVFAAPDVAGMARMAIELAQAAGKLLKPTAANLLAARMDGDTLRLGNEIARLSAYAGEEGEITAASVQSLVPPLLDDNLFHLLDAAFNGQARQALDILRAMFDNETSAFQILPSLTSTVRLLIQAKYLGQNRIRSECGPDQVPTEILSRLPVGTSLYDQARQSWKRERLWSQASRLSFDQLHAALDRLVLLEAGLKGWQEGIADPELAMETYILRLAGAGSPG